MLGKQRRRSFAELQGQAPRVTQHDEVRTVGELVIADGGGSSSDQTSRINRWIFAGEREVEEQGVPVGVVRNFIRRIAVDLQHGRFLVGEKVALTRLGFVTEDLESEVGAIPGGDSHGISYVVGDVFDFHR